MLRGVVVLAALSIGATGSQTLGQKIAGTAVEPLGIERVMVGLDRPIGLFHAPEDYRRLFVIEKVGVIRVYDMRKGILRAAPFLDIDSLVGGGHSDEDERGLLGLAFHPDYPSNGRFYVNYTDGDGSTVIQMHTVSKDPNVANPTGDVIFRLEQPYQNHNGGWMEFGPDGYLYIATGDGGNACDPQERAQDITGELHGKILRIDVDHDDFLALADFDYAIPSGNPFATTAGDDEIWAYGLRNPWRNSFDRETGDLYIADVGQGQIEEINILPANSKGGENYGWDCMEGTSCASVSFCNISEPGNCTCEGGDLTDPVHTYTHGGNPFRCSITGGAVYRGCAIPSLRGHYFYADYCSAQIWSFRYDPKTGVADLTERTSELAPDGAATIDLISSFGTDAAGELYIVDQGGEIFRIVPESATISPYDFDCNGQIDVNDLVSLILKWGDCEACRQDVTGDGTVDVEELVRLILRWG